MRAYRAADIAVSEIIIPAETVAFDFDGVIADTMGLFIQMIRNDHGITDISLENITDYDLTKCLDMSDDTLWDVLTRLSAGNHTEPLHPYPHSVDILMKILNHTGQLNIITARPDDGPVYSFFDNYIGEKGRKINVIATGTFEGKSDALLDLGITHFIEDRIETCFQVAPLGITPVLYIQPWNRRSHPFTEVSDWVGLNQFIRF